MKRFLAAVAVLLLLAPPAYAESVVSGSVPSNGKPPSVTPGGSWNGSSTIVWPGDSDGNPYVRSWAPAFELIEQKANVSMNAGIADSSVVPVDSRGYRQLFITIRVKVASFAAGAALEVGARGSIAAANDSTALGYFALMGNGIKGGRTKYLVTLGDRWFTVPVSDSLTGAPIQFPYAGHYVTNRTAAPVTLDIMLWGIRW